MIPTLILFGLVFGRWWRFSLVAAAVAWPVGLVLTDVMDLEWGLIGAAALAVSNTFVGVLVHQGVLWSVRGARS
jgi:hypothetical protein